MILLKKIKEEISATKATENTKQEISLAIDNHTLSMKELISKVELLAKNNNPYSVSKEIEEIKAIFYIKLKKITIKEIKESDKQVEEQNTVQELHPLEIKFKDVFAAFRRSKSIFRKNKEKKEEENLETKRKIINDINLLTKEEESLKVTFDKFRKLQLNWKKIGHVPIAENNHIWQSYNHHVELFYDFININNDLRDIDFKRNLKEKKIILKKAKALLDEPSIKISHVILQELHEQWRNVGPVEKKIRESLWINFQEISKEINKKKNDHFIEKKKKNSIKLKSKNSIVEEINCIISKEIKSYKQWELATIECNELEKKWRSLGKLNKKYNKIAWQNLKDALTNFYKAKNNFYKEKKKENEEVVKRKKDLCKKAETLKNSTDWQKTSKELILLQKEWKKNELFQNKQSNALWNRFRSACNSFFDARDIYYKLIEKEKEKIIIEIQKFKPLNNHSENIQKIKKISNKWNETVKNSIIRNKNNDIFFKLLNDTYSNLGINKKELSSIKYKNKVSQIKGDNKAIIKEKKLLKKKIEILKKQIIQYENNISFFGNGKETKILLVQVQKKIDKTKSDIKDIKDKLQMLNQA